MYRLMSKDEHRLQNFSGFCNALRTLRFDNRGEGKPMFLAMVGIRVFDYYYHRRRDLFKFFGLLFFLYVWSKQNHFFIWSVWAASHMEVASALAYKGKDWMDEKHRHMYLILGFLLCIFFFLPPANRNHSMNIYRFKKMLRSWNGCSC